MTAASPRIGSETATYLFAVCQGGDPAALEGLAGQGASAPVRLLSVGSLTAVVQDVPADDFSEHALQQRLSDRDELERCARAHHAVVTAAAAAAPTVPMPLATLYLGDERVRAALRESEPRFRTALSRIAGRVEWGVKVYAGPTPAPEASAPTRPDRAVSGAGRAYLEKVRTRQRARELQHDTALRAAERVDTALRGIAVAARRLRLHSGELTGAHRPQVLNAAYLVTRGRERELTAMVESLRRETGAGIETSGPWVPYSFTDGGTG
ncbi:GvpL/GvpF family gas vesicle protein [Streptomyces sp. 8N706]|uniref:GvpL/GvpF family gas vesicle protein n=1 Tax=Streptomyces sp. 8N706 TaxID=3457416 RepID=UPI003FD27343